MTSDEWGNCQCNFCLEYRARVQAQRIISGKESIHLTWWQKVRRFFT